MVSQVVTIKNASGLHARPAGVLVKEATKQKCNVYLQVGAKKIPAKSILNIMAAAIKGATDVEVVCDGEGEVESLAAMVAIIEGGLGE